MSKNSMEGVDFLDRLTYGEGSTPGMRQAWLEWREVIAARQENGGMPACGASRSMHRSRA